jgi:uncharacterized membrane protein
MHEWVVVASEYSIDVINAIALLFIVIATVRAALAAAPAVIAPLTGQQRREVWLTYARWLVAGLTFQLAADIIETAITTDWEAIGRVGVIAVIRTFLNYFLERDIAEARELQGAPRAADAHAET